MTTKHLLLIAGFCFFGSTFLAAQKPATSLAEIETQLRKVMHAGCGGHAHFDHDTELVKVAAKDKILQVFFNNKSREITGMEFNNMLESFLPALEEYGFEKLELLKILPDGSYMNLADIAKNPNTEPPKVLKNNDPFPNITGPENTMLRNRGMGLVTGNGALSGKTVWLSPGHGWLYNNTYTTYLTQRGNTHGMVEDFGSIENINQHLIRYLMNAGANVWSVRERDMNTNEVIVDNDEGAPTYTETGSWATSSSTGYNGGTYRYTTSTSGAATEAAIYTPDIPEAGWYWVSVYYRSGGNRSVDTQYKINHAGGESIVSINQETHGVTWVYLGQFYFDAGTSGNVMLLNSTTDPSGEQAIIADAVRFGGGIGDLNDCAYPDSPVSGRARFDECGRLYTRFQGYTGCEQDFNMRPKYAEWELSSGTTTEQNNAIYLSLHSNAFDGTARGTVTYMDAGVPSPNSQILRDLVQEELAGDIIADWDANWNDRGTNAANFGEVEHLTTMAGALVELAFHDNATDAAALQTPYFRNLAARAMYKGIVKFFNAVDPASPVAISPESPTHLRATNSGAGAITVAWDAPASGGVLGDPATGYRVYMGTHGYAFAGGVDVVGNSHTFTGLEPGQNYYFRVTSTNPGGESFPSSTVVARTPVSGGIAQVLIVDGFDRIDKSGQATQNPSTALGTVKRMFLDEMNSFNYMVPHAKSIGNCELAFDGAVNDALIAGYLSLNTYEAVDWITGEESTVDRSFDNTEQTLVMNFLDNGGKFIVSGAEIGWDVGRSSSANASLNFYNNYLKATYAGDDGGTYDFTGVAGGVFLGIDGSFDDGTFGNYNSAYPDRLGATGGSIVVLNYVGGTNDGAAVGYCGTDFGVFNFGFPLETITDSAVRDMLICEAMTCMGVEPPLCVAELEENAVPIAAGTYVAGERITSKGKVVDGTVVQFNAGTEICLDTLFEVELGADFEAVIEGCGVAQKVDAKQE